MDAVRGELVYEPGATDVQTRADEVLALGRGVCQDFAHVLLAACRSAGIPARYVSGYLYDPTLRGDNAASHAWVDVWDDARGLDRARPDARPRADRGLRPRRRRPRLRRRAADARGLQGRTRARRSRCGSACRRSETGHDCRHGPLRRRDPLASSRPPRRSPTWPTSRTRASGIRASRAAGTRTTIRSRSARRSPSSRASRGATSS